MMRGVISATTMAAVLLVSWAAARADEPTPAPPPADPAPPRAPPAAPPPTAPAETCVLGAHDGVADTDAQAAARLVCREVAQEGPAAGTLYRVGLSRLGRAVFLTLDAESPPGTVRDSRQVRLAGIEEVAEAAPRIASALVHGTSLEQTATTKNLVGEETRDAKKKAGSVHYGLGIVGIFPPLTRSVAPAPGLEGAIQYESGSLAAVAGLRGGAGTPDKVTIGYVAASIGGRYYHGDGDLAPYAGAGQGRRAYRQGHLCRFVLTL